MSRFSVIVADDHPLFREGVVRAVRAWPELELVAEVSNGREALEQIRALAPDVACVDLRLPEIDGIGIANAVTRDRLATRVLLLSAFADDELVYRALEAGAAGYLTKDSASEQLLGAIRKISAGGVHISEAAAASLIASSAASEAAPHRALSNREFEIFMLLVEGRGPTEIGEALPLSPMTVSTHKTRIPQKMNLEGTADLVRYALEHDLLQRKPV